MPQLPLAASYAIVFATLAVFGVTAIVGLKVTKFDSSDRDAYFSARNSQSTFSLAMTFFASGVGAWVLFAVVEVGTYTGSIGVAGYALSVIAPLIILDKVSPFLRRELPHGVTLHDFIVQVRRRARGRQARRGTPWRCTRRPMLCPRAPRARALRARRSATPPPQTRLGRTGMTCCWLHATQRRGAASAGPSWLLAAG